MDLERRPLAVAVAAYLAATLLLLRAVVPNYRADELRRFELASRFKSAHTRLKANTESVAFFGGDDVERTLVQGRFDDWEAFERRTLRRERAAKVLLGLVLRHVQGLKVHLLAAAPLTTLLRHRKRAASRRACDGRVRREANSRRRRRRDCDQSHG